MKIPTLNHFPRLPRFRVGADAATSKHSYYSGKRIPLILVPLVVLLALAFQLHRQWGGWSSSVRQLIKRPPEVGIVVASLRSEDTSWVHRHLPDWSRSVYVVDEPTAKLTVPKNKGREAMVYLSHIIDNYDNLTPVTVFMHASRFAWHNDDPDYDALPTLRNLNLSYVRSSGYANLRCIWILGCPVEIAPHADAAPAGDGGRKLTTKEIFKQAFEELMPGVQVPEKVGVSCCSQFAVSREAVRARPREDYVRWRDWLLQTPLADDLSGRVFEYMWHIIFGKDAVFCPSAAECYCNLYGLCNLKCQESTCEGRYVLPEFATLPDGWPRVGWSGEERNFTGPD
ncbi:uncharacterized protein P884DRAFT_203114 [Thermothelomyces heterothallicus CBS 202.75]|uniref:uncharacterized protein n=1 Tax=Thermothelomyces heterothallicus CBS 202.75 TaxID=1149848 RepID=UPI003742CB1C